LRFFRAQCAFAQIRAKKEGKKQEIPGQIQKYSLQFPPADAIIRPS
jgi:hypothetical protein